MTVSLQHEITVGLAERSYNIAVGTGLLDAIGGRAQHLGFHSPIPIITDSNVGPLYAERVKQSLEQAGYSTNVITFKAGEASKHLDTVSQLYDQMVQLRPERKSGLIALGGGVVGDVAGFVAATYLRGIPFIQVPTTLLAQVDASVGGKVGIDHPGGKNLIGAFHQPREVVIDTGTLTTLSQREIRAGLAEAIKHGIIADADLYSWTEQNLSRLLQVDLDAYNEVIPRNCQIKAHVVEQDERESGLRAILNFGHTIGHAIEALTKYSQYLHGEAIAIGMLAEAQLGSELGITPVEEVERIHALLKQTGYPLDKPKITADELIESMFRDKKVESGKLRFVFPKRIGDVVIQSVEDIQAIRRVWENDSV